MNLAYLALMYKDNPVLTRQNHRATCTSLNCTRSRWSQDHDTLLRPTVQSTLDLKENYSIFLGFCNVAVIHWWRPNPNLAWSFSFGFKRDELHQEAPYGRAFVRGNIGLSGSRSCTKLTKKRHEMSTTFLCSKYHLYLCSLYV